MTHARHGVALDWRIRAADVFSCDTTLAAGRQMRGLAQPDERSRSSEEVTLWQER
jgi:hypothetical protein